VEFEELDSGRSERGVRGESILASRIRVSAYVSHMSLKAPLLSSCGESPATPDRGAYPVWRRPSWRLSDTWECRIGQRRDWSKDGEWRRLVRSSSQAVPRNRIEF